VHAHSMEGFTDYYIGLKLLRVAFKRTFHFTVTGFGDVYFSFSNAAVCVHFMHTVHL